MVKRLNASSGAGFTLVELLVSVFIVAVMVSLTFAAFQKSRQVSKRSGCIAQLRQLGEGIEVYEQDAGSLPQDFDLLADTGYLAAPQILLCPSDPFLGYFSEFANCHQGGVRVPHHRQSYETNLWWPQNMKTALQQADQNYGIAACRLHANRTELFSSNPTQFCSKAWLMFDGPLLRLRKDGSVQTARLTLRPEPNLQGSGLGFNVYWLYTDEKVEPPPP